MSDRHTRAQRRAADRDQDRRRQARTAPADWAAMTPAEQRARLRTAAS